MHELGIMTSVMSVVQQTAEQTVAFGETLTRQIEQQLLRYAEAYPEQYKLVDISDDRAASEAATTQ